VAVPLSKDAMTKNNLIDQVAEATQTGKKDAEQIIDAVLTQIAQALSKGEKVDLRGFGSFQANHKKERQGRNPQTGETMTIAAKTVAVFRPSKELAERVNQAATANSGD
jgi:nucleoid DNA-binding protein